MNHTMKKILTAVATFASATFFAALAVAQEHGSPGAGASGAAGYLALASGLGIAIASFGGALGQGRAAAAALEGIARNPGAAGTIQTPMIIGLALIESLVIYSLVIAFLLQAKI